MRRNLIIICHFDPDVIVGRIYLISISKSIFQGRGVFTMIDTKLLDILACPACKGDVEYDARNEKILCTQCKKKYPVKDGIPVMLVEEAEE